MPKRVRQAVSDKSAERGLQHLGVVCDQFAAQTVKKVLYAPTADDGVVRQDHEGCENGDAAHNRKDWTSQVLESMQCRTAAGTAHDEFSNQQRDADCERKNNVRNDETRAAVDAGPERKFPDGAQADGRACTGQNKADPGPPGCCGGCHIVWFVCCVVLIEGEVGCRLLADRYLMSIAMRGFRCEIQFQQSSAEPF